MHFQKVNKAIWPLIFFVGLFKITGLEAVENEKTKQDSSPDYDYDAPSGEIAQPNPTARPNLNTNPFFERPVNIVYASQEGENVTLKCAPKKFNEAKHSILWYRDDTAITNGNITLATGNFDVDNNHSLTIYNYTSQTPGNFSCHVLPGDDKQYVRIEIKAPDNISESNAASPVKYFDILKGGVMLISLLLTTATKAY